MRDYCFKENILSNAEIENITNLIIKIKDEDIRIAHQKILMNGCKNCKNSRNTIKECKGLIKGYLKELKNTYSIKEK